jgi:hypothetical protein
MDTAIAAALALIASDAVVAPRAAEPGATTRISGGITTGRLGLRGCDWNWRDERAAQPLFSPRPVPGVWAGPVVS